MNKEMKNQIKNFIMEVNPILKVRFQKYDLECDIFEEIIYIGQTYDKKTDDYFKDFVCNIYPECEKFNIFLLSLLHEIGHIETWTEDDANNKDIVYEMLKMQYDEEEKVTDEKMKEYCQKYFRIPLEWNATEWGIHFALTHQDLMEKYSFLHN